MTSIGSTQVLNSKLNPIPQDLGRDETSADDVKQPAKNIFQRIREAYLRAVKSLVACLRKRKWYVAAMVIGTLLAEPWCAIKAGFQQPLGWKKHFNFYGMNAKQLTSEQANQRAILLIHGNYDNQRAWLSLGKRLKKEKLGPVFTVNLPNGSYSHKDKEILEKKWSEIRSLYNNPDLKIDVIGHSRGSIGLMLGFPKDGWSVDKTLTVEPEKVAQPRKEVGRIINIGSPIDKWEHDWSNTTGFIDRVYEVNGNHDLLVNESPGYIPESRTFSADCGHLALTTSTQVQDKIVEWLKY